VASHAPPSPSAPMCREVTAAVKFLIGHWPFAGHHEARGSWVFSSCDGEERGPGCGWQPRHRSCAVRNPASRGYRSHSRSDQRPSGRTLCRDRCTFEIPLAERESRRFRPPPPLDVTRPCRLPSRRCNKPGSPICGSLAIFAAILRASSLVSNLAAKRQCSGLHRRVSKKSTTLALSADEARPPYGFILLPFTTASGFAMKRSSVALSQTKSALCMALE
jgi:hypothetical protein